MVNENPVEQFYFSIPPITRTYLTLSTILAALVSLNFVTPYQLYLNFNLILAGEWWRIFTTFLFFDKFGITYIFQAYFFYIYCRRLEEHSFHNKHAEFAMMILYGIVALLFSTAFFRIPFLSNALSTMILYYWSRRNPTEQLRFYGLFLVNASYFPYILLGLSILLGHSIWSDILGIAVGHTYYYTNDVLPVTFNVHLYRTPRWLKKLFGEIEEEDLRMMEEIEVVQDDDAWNINHDATDTEN